ncbi:hypothetical protein [Methanolapillus ohkumae]|uniref:Uncharacterized protein n=1 Tax=Methanolapillus ohkumae TaxID=3028298 RepID=A0AA96ZVP4_9EURY|nr:hypothetical protein MsAm2_08660 [Methanosarcinaceae archaeon Am2]
MSDENAFKDKNIRLNDVVKCFQDLPTNGELFTLKVEELPKMPFEPCHIQGFTKIKDTFILSHSGHLSRGLFYIGKEDQKLVMSKTPYENFNHPGGMQCIGDYFLCGIEKGGDQSGKDSYISLFLFDSMTNSAKHINKFDIHRDKGSMGVGITNYIVKNENYYLIAVSVNNFSIDFYRAKSEILESAKFEKIFTSSYKHWGDDGAYQSIALLTDKTEKVYMVGFRAQPSSLTYEDWLDLYHVDIDKKELNLVKQKIGNEEGRKHLYTKHSHNLMPSIGVHFRYGAGIQIFSEDKIKIYATERNIQSDKMEVNVFKKK